ncbi:MAG: hypothetical protein LBR80_16780, partial [Deltaproteobacteria bacterium]|nr:hypothetical protein [Deltaproteobacteria bacterium]
VWAVEFGVPGRPGGGWGPPCGVSVLPFGVSVLPFVVSVLPFVVSVLPFVVSVTHFAGPIFFSACLTAALRGEGPSGGYFFWESGCILGA